MTLSQMLKGYIEETPIHGFGFIPKSSSVKTTVFWTIIIIAGYGLATNDLINLIMFYQSVPTLVNVEVHRRSDLEHPVPVLCIEINNFLFPPPDRHGGSATIQKYVPMLINKTDGLTKIRDPPQYANVWTYLPYDLFYYTYAMLGFMSSFQLTVAEHDYAGFYYGVFDSAVLFRQNLTGYTIKDVPYIEELFQTYRRHNVSFESLNQFISGIICSRYISTQSGSISYAEFEGRKLEFAACSYGSFTHLSFGLMCLRIANASIWSLKNFDLVIGGVSTGQFLFGMPPAVTDHAFLWHIDFQGRSLRGSNDTTNVLSFPAPAPDRSHTNTYDYDSYLQFFDPPHQFTDGIPIMSTIVVNVETSAYYQFFNRYSKPCKQAKQMFNLKLEQEAELFYAKCHCWPHALYSGVANLSKGRPDCSNLLSSVTPSPNKKYFSSRFPWDPPQFLSGFSGNSSLPIFTIGIFYNKGGFLTNADDVMSYNFSSQCTGIATPSSAVQIIEECDMIRFTITQSTERTTTFAKEPIRIKVRNELYNAIIETPYKTWSTFMSEFGGSIGTWLGGSLIAFVHIPVFFGRIALHYCKRRKTVDCNSEEKVEENVSGEQDENSGKNAVENYIYVETPGNSGRPITI